MCKVPRSGTSKTRLSPPLTADEAAEISRCFIADVAHTIAALPEALQAQGVAVYTPEGEEEGLAGLLPEGFARLAQRGQDLGERLHNAMADLLRAGFEGVCLINSDSPTLPPRLLADALEALRRPGERVVLGPAIDGGYTLIGLMHPRAALFEDIAWSTSQVLTQTLGRAAAERLDVALLPLWYDVDDATSLQLLIEELFGRGMGLDRGFSLVPAARTRAYLGELLAVGHPELGGHPAREPG